jgi:hypothetical protein
MDWIDTALDRDRWRILVNEVPKNSKKFGEFLDYLRTGYLLKDFVP